MATEQQQPATTVRPPPREPQPSSPTLGETAGGAGPSQPVEFRGFDFFAQRDFNEYKNASQAYFAEKNGNPSSWLGDATPPASAHPSLDEPRPEEFPQPPSNAVPKDEKKILGLRRPWFWTLLAIIVVVVIVAIGLGLGIGLTRKNNDSKSASAVGPASDGAGTTMTDIDTPVTSGMATATSSLSPTSTHTRTTSTQMSAATAGVETSCPEINGTIYNVPGSTKKFLQLCGVDHGEEDGAVDIRNVYTDTAEDCIENCAGTKGCTGCGWGYIEGDEGPPYRCWLKSNVNGTSHNADKTWHFATLL
ncbi:hypothetical protein ANO14919_067210 [Xylariales sp. No.14919]|nr:hypothetical protein ANO14919_067210 [Xylariales sp. No.14919]